MELVCPAGSLAALKAAVDNGADAVYLGFRDASNARHFPGLNFSEADLLAGMAYARAAQTKVYFAINTYPQADNWQVWASAVDRAAELQADAVIIADMGVLDYASERYPDLRLHLSVQASATNPQAIAFYAERFAVKRVVLPRVLSFAQVAQVAKASPVPVEVFGFGSLCVMVEGRCWLSSYVTGQSPNSYGACSPAAFVEWRSTGTQTEARLNNVLVDRYKADEHAAYPTICKGRFSVNNKLSYALEQPVSLNTLSELPKLADIGVAAIKLEGRQRSPLYVAQVCQVFRQAIDALRAGKPDVASEKKHRVLLASHSEGAQTTLGAYDRVWR